MKVQIKQEFIDKYTGQKYLAGAEVDFTEDRIAEINQVDPDLISVVAQKETKTKQKKEKVD